MFFKIVINSDLNSLLIKNYDFDIKRNCKSLKDLEKMLEIIAIEISDEYKKHNKRSHVIFSCFDKIEKKSMCIFFAFPKQTLLTLKNKNGQWRSSDNMIKSDEKKQTSKNKLVFSIKL